MKLNLRSIQRFELYQQKRNVKPRDNPLRKNNSYCICRKYEHCNNCGCIDEPFSKGQWAYKLRLRVFGGKTPEGVNKIWYKHEYWLVNCLSQVFVDQMPETVPYIKVEKKTGRPISLKQKYNLNDGQIEQRLRYMRNLGVYRFRLKLQKLKEPLPSTLVTIRNLEKRITEMEAGIRVIEGLSIPEIKEKSAQKTEDRPVKLPDFTRPEPRVLTLEQIAINVAELNKNR